MDTLNQEQIEAALGELGEWGFQGEALTRTFRFADFVHAIGFVEHLAEVAEERQHHPDIDIRYNKVTLHLSTHERRRRHDARRRAGRGHRAPGLTAGARPGGPRAAAVCARLGSRCPRSSGD